MFNLDSKKLIQELCLLSVGLILLIYLWPMLLSDLMMLQVTLAFCRSFITYFQPPHNIGPLLKKKKKKIVTITLKILSDTRWESKIKSVEPMGYQPAAVRDTLIEVRDHTKKSRLNLGQRRLGYTALPIVQWCGMTFCAKFNI